MKKPFFSIVTIVLNGGALIERTIKSVLAQSFDDYEYIIIDGGSTDNTLAIVDKYRAHIDTVVSEPDRGISHAFNKGIAQAKGEFVGFINCDDFLVPDCLSIVHQAYLNNPKGEIFCGAVDFYDGDSFLVKTPSFPQKLKTESTVHQSSCFMRKVLFDRFQPFGEEWKYAMDYEIFLRLYLKGVTYIAVPETLSIRDVNGLTGKYAFKAFEELRVIRQQYFSRLNVFFHYYFFVVKLYWGRVMRKRFLPLYRLYWWGYNWWNKN